MTPRSKLIQNSTIILFLAAASSASAQQTWGALDLGLSGAVTALQLSGGVLYAGGNFTGFIAQWNGTTWTAVGTGGPSGAVYAMAALNGNLYAGGAFL